MARFGGFALDVPSEPHDEIINRARIRVFMKVPDILQDGFAGNGLATVSYQITQKLCFHQSKLKYLARAAELEICEINCPVVKLEHVRGLHGRGVRLLGI